VETVAQLPNIRDARHYVILQIKPVKTEFIANAEFNASDRHELRQAICDARRDRKLIACAFKLHDATDPARRRDKASGSFRDEVREPSMDGGCGAICADTLNSKRAAAAIKHVKCAVTTIRRTLCGDERRHAIKSASARKRPFRTSAFRFLNEADKERLDTFRNCNWLRK
jgi:hypothetical protein